MLKNPRTLLQARIAGKGIGVSNCRYYSTLPRPSVTTDLVPGWEAGLINYNNSIMELFNNNDCFYIAVFKSNKHKLGEGISLNLVINSSVAGGSEKLLYELLNIIGNCGKIAAKPKKNYYCLTVKDFKSIFEKIIPFLEKEIGGLNVNKKKAFQYWKEAANLINLGAHTTFEGLNEIKKIKLLMSNFEIKEELSLVPYGANLSSTVGYLKFSNLERSLIKIPFNKRSVFIGIILSDAALQRVNDSGDARLQFKQKYSQFEYLYSVFFQLSHYCSKGPTLNKVLLHKKIFYALSFTTRSLPCITELYNLFYPALRPSTGASPGRKEGKKIIPHNIYDLLTFSSLAHWVYLKSNIKFLYFNRTRKTKSRGLYIDVKSLGMEDIVKLINVLICKFNLICSLKVLKQDKLFIYIKNKSIPLLLNGVSPYINDWVKYSGTNTYNLRTKNMGDNKSLFDLQSRKFSTIQRRLPTSYVTLDVKKQFTSLNNLHALNCPVTENNNNIINPGFITGFVDGEGSFQIVVLKNNEIKIGAANKKK